MSKVNGRKIMNGGANMVSWVDKRTDQNSSFRRYIDTPLLKKERKRQQATLLDHAQLGDGPSKTSI